MAGCAAFAPIPERSPTDGVPVRKEYAGSAGAETITADSLSQLFNDATLDALVSRALANNLDVRLAARQMELAGFFIEQAGSALLPGVQARVGNSRNGSPASGTASTGLDVSWEIDLWGRLQDERSATRLDQKALAQQLFAVQASVAAQTMQGWFAYVRAGKAIDIENQRLDVLRRSKDYIQQSYRSGIGTLDDLSAIERDIALSRDVVLANRAEQSQLARSLELLLGEYPDGIVNGASKFPKLPPPPKAGLPAELLTQRPDLRREWLNVAAADRRISVAQKDLLPQISLTGSLGSSSAELGTLLSGATIWSFASNLTAPVFDGKRRKTEILASRNRADQAWIGYLQTALTAFGEVERALDQETNLRQREAALNDAIGHAEGTAKLFQTRYQAGIASILDYLNAQNAVFNIRSQHLSVRADRLSNRVALGLALGKGI